MHNTLWRTLPQTNRARVWQQVTGWTVEGFGAKSPDVTNRTSWGAGHCEVFLRLFCVKQYMFGWALNEEPSSRRLGGGKYISKYLRMNSKWASRLFSQVLQWLLSFTLSRCWVSVFFLNNERELICKRQNMPQTCLSVTQSSKVASRFFRTLVFFFLFFFWERGGGEVKRIRGNYQSFRDKRNPNIFTNMWLRANDSQQWDQLAFCGSLKSTSPCH